MDQESGLWRDAHVAVHVPPYCTLMNAHTINICTYRVLYAVKYEHIIKVIERKEKYCDESLEFLWLSSPLQLLLTSTVHINIKQCVHLSYEWTLTTIPVHEPNCSVLYAIIVSTQSEAVLHISRVVRCCADPEWPPRSILFGPQPARVRRGLDAPERLRCDRLRRLDCAVLPAPHLLFSGRFSHFKLSARRIVSNSNRSRVLCAACGRCGMRWAAAARSPLSERRARREARWPP